jgi:sugar lactone lactonase YvrE
MSQMRNKVMTVLALASVGVLATTMQALAGPVVPDPGNLDHVHPIATFDPGAGGAFAESMTALGHGRQLVSLDSWGAYDQATDTWGDNSGQLWLVRPGGTMTRFGRHIALGQCGMILGVAMNHDAAYVALFNFGPDPTCTHYTPPSGVLKVTPHRTTRVMTLPDGSWPNGVTIHAGKLYVTDSGLGAIWRGPTAKVSAPTTPWFSSPRLAPDQTYGLGANGIAFRGDTPFVLSYGQGSLVRVVRDATGRPTGARVVAKNPALVTGDGLTFDAAGRAWVATNANALVMVDRTGSVVVADTPVGSLDYPTQVTIGWHGNVYVLNGSYDQLTPALVVFRR